MASLASPNYIAGGNINIASFVKLVFGTSYTVVQCLSAGDKPIGVAQQGSKQPPGVVGSDGLAAHLNEPVQVFGPGDVCRIQVSASSTGVNAGDALVSDSSGNGYALSTSPTAGSGLQWIGAFALANGTANQLIRALVTGPVPFDADTTQVFSVSLAPINVLANTSAEQTFAVTGLPAGAQVSVSPPSITAGTGIVGARVKAAGSLGQTFGNFTAASLVPANGVYLITAVV